MAPHLIIPCDTCKGDAKLTGKMCESCHGSGVTDLTRNKTQLLVAFVLAVGVFVVLVVVTLILLALSKDAWIVLVMLTVMMFLFTLSIFSSFIEASERLHLHSAAQRLKNLTGLEPYQIGPDGELADLSPDQEKPKRQKL